MYIAQILGFRRIYNITAIDINTVCSFEQRELEHKYIYIYRA